MAITNLTSETTQLAAQMAPEFKFGSAEITAACPTARANLFGESIGAMMPTMGKAITTCSAVTIASGNLGLGALGALGVTTFDVLTGGGKGARQK
jgi:hypothetical protein